MNKILSFSAIAILLMGCGSESKEETTTERPVEKFLTEYNTTFQELLAVSSEAEWKSNTYIVEGDTVTAKAAEVANEALATFSGSAANIELARAFLLEKEVLTDIEIRQLETILYSAGANPGNVMSLVKQKIKADGEQNRNLFSHTYMIDGKEVSPNEIDRILRESTDQAERLAAWESSKEVGINLKPGLANLRDLRNGCVQALEYKDYFAYQVSDYGMTSEELIEVCRDMIKVVEI